MAAESNWPFVPFNISDVMHTIAYTVMTLCSVICLYIEPTIGWIGLAMSFIYLSYVKQLYDEKEMILFIEDMVILAAYNRTDE